jgi:hypothetical protein
MHMKQDLSLRTELGDYRGLAFCLTNMAFAAHKSGDSVRATRLFGAADTLRRRENIELGQVDQKEYDDVINHLRKALKPTNFGRAWSWEGTLGIERITAYAMGTDA